MLAAPIHRPVRARAKNNILRRTLEVSNSPVTIGKWHLWTIVCDLFEITLIRYVTQIIIGINQWHNFICEPMSLFFK